MSKPIECWGVHDARIDILYCGPGHWTEADATERVRGAEGARVVHLREVVTCGECRLRIDRDGSCAGGTGDDWHCADGERA